MRIYSRLMFRLSMVSHSPIPSGPKIIVANYPTGTDPFILTSVSNGPAAVLINSPAFEVPIFGSYLRWAGHISVNQKEGKIAFEKALALLKKNVTVIIFIEGGFSKFIHKLGKPKTGAIRLAISSGHPIVPIGIAVKRKNIRTLSAVINGTQKWGKWYLNGPYAITVGKTINISGDVSNKSRVRKLSRWLSKRISFLQNESARRIKV